MASGVEKIIRVLTPVQGGTVEALRVGDKIEITGKIYCGRDAVLPKIVQLHQTGALDPGQVDLEGSVIFHTAVSPAGIGPTTSNKEEIEGSMPGLSRAGVKIHLGKGSLAPGTIRALKRYQSLFAVTPPVSALLTDRVRSKRIAAFEEEGMEALYELEVEGVPAIIAIAHGDSIFSKSPNLREAGLC